MGYLELNEKRYQEYLIRNNKVLLDSKLGYDEETDDYNYEMFDSIWTAILEKLDLIFKQTNNYLFNDKPEFVLVKNQVDLTDMFHAKNGFTMEIENDDIVIYSTDGNFDNGLPYISRFSIRCIEKSSCNEWDDLKRVFNSSGSLKQIEQFFYLDDGDLIGDIIPHFDCEGLDAQPTSISKRQKLGM